MGGIDAARRKQTLGLDTWDEPAAPTPQTQKAEPAPWNVDYDKIPAALLQYDRSLFATPPVRVASPSATAASQEWPALPTMPDLRPNRTSGARCAPPLPAIGNAQVVADKRLPLGLALNDGAFQSAADLERFIEEYVAYTATRAVDAALVLAPFAAKALSKGVRGAAELLRLARATGRSIEESRVLCRTAVEVSRHRTAVREGIAAAKAGRTLTSEQRAAMDGVARASAEGEKGQALRRRMYQATVKSDGSLAAGTGATDRYGNVTFSPHGSPKDVALAKAHESVHSFLSPKALNGLRELRADVGMAAYEKSALCRYLEEAMAETYAQVEVNGIRALPEGLTFPLRGGYDLTLRRVATEGAIGAISYGGVLYAVHLAVSRK